MTRQDEIRAAAERAYPYKGGTKGYICEGSISIFIKGAEWADATAWRPSDEQIKTLEYYMHSLICTKHKEVLFGLYEQLKKLKGE